MFSLVKYLFHAFALKHSPFKMHGAVSQHCLGAGPVWKEENLGEFIQTFTGKQSQRNNISTHKTLRMCETKWLWFVHRNSEHFHYFYLITKFNRHSPFPLLFSVTFLPVNKWIWLNVCASSVNRIHTLADIWQSHTLMLSETECFGIVDVCVWRVVSV